MARSRKSSSTRDAGRSSRGSRGGDQLPEPVDVVEGVPDRSSDPALWKYLALAVIFVAWVCLLLLCLLAGAP